jgi:hypothetical protein
MGSREDFRLVKIAEYQLAGAKVFVLNLAVGDYNATYGADEPPVTGKPAPMHLDHHCRGVSCYSTAYTMHHGNHFEVSLVSAPDAKTKRRWDLATGAVLH